LQHKNETARYLKKVSDFVFVKKMLKWGCPDSYQARLSVEVEGD